jgi:hypothetical protein
MKTKYFFCIALVFLQELQFLFLRNNDEDMFIDVGKKIKQVP